MRIMASIIDKVLNMNWVGLVKHKILHEHGRFSTNKAIKKVEIEKKVSLLHKVSLILKDKIPDHEWDPKGLKTYLPRNKAILQKDVPLTGLADDDPTPTRKKEVVAAP